MKNFKRSLLSMLLVLVLVLSSVVVPSYAAATEPKVYSSEYNSGQRGVVATTLSGTSASSYYTGSYAYDVLSTKSSSEIKSSLKTLMTNTHSYTSSYNDCHYKANRTDCENETGAQDKLLLLYTSYTATQSQWNGWNREHVWPQSLGGGNTSGGGADLHHIRPSDAVVNSTRGNKKYGNTNGGTAKYGSNPATGYLGGYYNSTYFEPVDAVKGDVARICLYVLVRWGSSWGADSITEVFQSVDVLLEWCILDPVDTWELGRNEVVQDIQGNRNVFIDYPEYAWLIFDREVPANLVTPSGEAGEGNTSGGNQSGTVTPDPTPDPVCTHKSTEVRGKVTATCTTEGYTGDTYCKDCGEKLASGTTQNAKGHLWNSWVTDEEAGIKTRTCFNGCGAVETVNLGAPTCKHNNTTVKDAKAATCLEKGYSGDVYCSDCNVKVSSGIDIPAKGHTWSEWVENTDEGVRVRGCTECSATETQQIEIPVCTHQNTEIRGAQSATCGLQGYTGDTYCKECGEKTASGEGVAATGEHTWSDPVVKVEPTETEDGEAVCTCTVCGNTKSVVISHTPAPEQPPVDNPTTPDTPTVDAEPTWGEAYKTEEETVVAILSLNAICSIVASLLTR